MLGGGVVLARRPPLGGEEDGEDRTAGTKPSPVKGRTFFRAAVGWLKVIWRFFFFSGGEGRGEGKTSSRVSGGIEEDTPVSSLWA